MSETQPTLLTVTPSTVTQANDVAETPEQALPSPSHSPQSLVIETLRALSQASLSPQALTSAIDSSRLRTTFSIPQTQPSGSGPDLGLLKHAESGLSATLDAITQAAVRDLLAEKKRSSVDQSVLAPNATVVAEAALASVTSVTRAVPALPWDVASTGEIATTPSSSLGSPTSQFPRLQLLSTSRSFSSGTDHDAPLVYATLASFQTRITHESLPITPQGTLASKLPPSLFGDGVETKDISTPVSCFLSAANVYGRLFMARTTRLFSALLGFPSKSVFTSVQAEIQNPVGKSSQLQTITHSIDLLHKLIGIYLSHLVNTSSTSTVSVYFATELYPSRTNVDAIIAASNASSVQSSGTVTEAKTACILLALWIALGNNLNGNPLDMDATQEQIEVNGLEALVNASAVEPTILIAHLLQVALYADRAHLPAAHRPPESGSFARLPALERLWWKRQIWLGLLHLAATPIHMENATPEEKTPESNADLPTAVATIILAQYYASTTGHALSQGIPMNVHDRPDYHDDAPQVADPEAEKDIEVAKASVSEIARAAAEAGAVVNLVQFMTHPFSIPLYEDAARGVMGNPHSVYGYEPVRQPTRESYLCRDTLDGLPLWLEDTTLKANAPESEPDIETSTPPVAVATTTEQTTPHSKPRSKKVDKEPPTDPHRPQSLTVAMVAAFYDNAASLAFGTSGQNPSVWITQRGLARAQFYYDALFQLASRYVRTPQANCTDLDIYDAFAVFARVGKANVVAEAARQMATNPPASLVALSSTTPASIAHSLEVSARMNADEAAAQSSLSAWLNAKTMFESALNDLRALVAEHPDMCGEAEATVTDPSKLSAAASSTTVGIEAKSDQTQAASAIHNHALGTAFHLLGVWGRRRGMLSLFKLPRSTSRLMKRFYSSALRGHPDGIVSLAESYTFASVSDPTLSETERKQEQDQRDEMGAAWYLVAAERYNHPEAWLGLAVLSGMGRALKRRLQSVLARSLFATSEISKLVDSLDKPATDSVTTLGTQESNILQAWNARYSFSCDLRAAVLGHPIAQHNFAQVLAQGLQTYAVSQTNSTQANEQQSSIGTENQNVGRRMPSLLPRTIKDERAAVLWNARAAIRGAFVPAMFALAVALEDGRAVLGDDNAAARWYRAAALCGRAEAQYNLGLNYLHNRGISSPYTGDQLDQAVDLAGGVSKTPEPRVNNLCMAKYWFKRAALQGLQKAIERLSEIRANELLFPPDRKQY